MQMKRCQKTLAGLFLSTSLMCTSVAIQPLEVRASDIEGYLVQADQYLAVYDPVSAMKVLVDAINVCGKDARLVAKADDIRSHTFVTSRKVLIQNGALGTNPISSEMVLISETRGHFDANGAWTSSTLGVNNITTPPDGMEYSVSSDVPADANGFFQSSLYRVSYDSAGRVRRVIRRWDANISWKYNVFWNGGFGSESSISTFGPYQVMEFQYDDLNRVTEYRRYYVDSDETTEVLSTAPKEFAVLKRYVYGADGSRTEYEMQRGKSGHSLSVNTYTSIGQLIESKSYAYRGAELRLTIEECMAKGQLLDHDTYSYPTAYQKEYTSMKRYYGETDYKTSHTLYERIGSDLELDEQGNLVPTLTDISQEDNYSYSINRDATGRLIQYQENLSYDDIGYNFKTTINYSYNQAGKLTELNEVSYDGPNKSSAKKKITYLPDGGYVIETLGGELHYKETFDRFGNRTQYLDYSDPYCDCLEVRETYNYDGTLLSHESIRHKGGASWNTGDFYEYDYFGNIIKETGEGNCDSWNVTHFYQYTYHYDPNHIIPYGYGL